MIKYVSNTNFEQRLDFECVAVYLSAKHKENMEWDGGAGIEGQLQPNSNRFASQLRCAVCEDTLIREPGYYCSLCGHGKSHPPSPYFTRNTELSFVHQEVIRNISKRGLRDTTSVPQVAAVSVDCWDWTLVPLI